LHRTNGPAVIERNGDELWYQNGVLHRDGDFPAVIRQNGKSLIWIKNGHSHREQGPAIILPNGRQEWYLNGVRHRDGGPAIIDPVKGDEYWKHGEKHEYP
jgi:hypothetical protein